MVTLESRGKKLTPPLVEKLNALELASKIGVKPAARQLNMCLRTLKRWRQKSTALFALSNDRTVDRRLRVRLPGAGRPPSIKGNTEEELITYFDARRAENKVVNVAMLAKLLRILDPSVVDATNVVLESRIWRMLRRNKISLRRTTHQAQRTRLNQEVIDDWISVIKEQMGTYGVDHAHIANFDETPVYFSPVCDLTLNRVGERTISVHKSDTSQRCTAMIGVSGEGHKFPPFVIFKGSTGRTGLIAIEL